MVTGSASVRPHLVSMPLTRRTFAASLPAFAAVPSMMSGAARAESALPRRSAPSLEDAFDAASALPQLNAMIVAVGGEVARERVCDGPGLNEPVNVKSASKTVLSALVGVAIDRGVLTGVDQALGELIPDRIPAGADPRVGDITVGDLLSMRAGLQSTSGRGYGPWVVSDDWTAYALSRPMVAEPGGRMIYSTGSSHLLSVALTAASGRSTLALARDYLGEPLGLTVPPWTRDPQGVFMGGNEMALSPRALLAIGELYRNGGTRGGARVLPASWVEESWRRRGRSRWTGAGYGYGWWLGRAGGEAVSYAWGYGGQMIYVVPSLGLTAVMTSDPDARGVDGHVQALHRLLAERIMPAVRAAS